MKPTAIVYTSNTGHTARYAQLLGRETGLPVYALAEAKGLPQGTPIIYLGWLMASQVKGCKQAARRFTLLAVCGVGLGKSGSQLEQVRRASALPEETPLYTLQGGLDKEKLRGANKALIGVLTRALEGTKNRTAEQEEMLQLIRQGGDFVGPENLAEVLAWYRAL